MQTQIHQDTSLVSIDDFKSSILCDGGTLPYMWYSTIFRQQILSYYFQCWFIAPITLSASSGCWGRRCICSWRDGDTRQARSQTYCLFAEFNNDGKWCRSGELNPGPTDYESHLSYWLTITINAKQYQNQRVSAPNGVMPIYAHFQTLPSLLLISCWHDARACFLCWYDGRYNLQPTTFSTATQFVFLSVCKCRVQHYRNLELSVRSGVLFDWIS